VAVVIPDPVVRAEARLGLIAAGDEIRAARLRPRKAGALGLRVAGYRRDGIASLTGETGRSVERQLGRAGRKLSEARRSSAEGW